MKWLTIASVLCYLCRHSDAGALKCSPDSKDPGCLREIREKISPQNIIERAKGSETAECLAGSEWESNCHKCRCSDTGLAECVRADTCDHTVVARESKCEPGTRWKDDCNTCMCLENGRVACTKRGCVNFYSNLEKRDTQSVSQSPNLNHSITKRAVCKPNQEFQIDCNACKCASNGQSYTCTHNECLEGDNTNKEVEVFMESEGTDHIERHSVCKPRDTFYVACNTCHCNTYGTDYSCSNKPCPLPKDVELFHELIENATASSNNTKTIVCVANRMFIRDCNTCWCNEDGTSYFCTRKVCLSDNPDETTTEDPNLEGNLRVVKQKCRPNEVFEMDCNMCRCNPEGNSYSCTRRACIETDKDDKNSSRNRDVRAVQEAPKTCQPGQEFRIDCNKCLCNDDGYDYSCTRNDCGAQNNNGGDTFVGTRTKRDTSEKIKMECSPGSVFDRECNVCRCADDGKHAICTIRGCKTTDDTAVKDPTPSFRCTPGDQYKTECNDCTCSADGKNVFCTLRLCDQI